MKCATGQKEEEMVVSPNDKYERELKEAIRQQYVLGRERIWKGIITQKMGDIMETIYRQREDSQQLNGTSWARQVV